MEKNGDVDLLYDYFLSHSNLDPTNSYSRIESQFGCGVGSFLGGMCRTVFPLLRNGSMMIGRELLRNSTKILGDEVTNKIKLSRQNKQSMKRKNEDEITNVNSKTPKLIKKSDQSIKNTRRRKISVKKNRDIRKLKTNSKILSKHKRNGKSIASNNKKKNQKDVFSPL